MSAWRLVWKSLWHHWRLNLAVALGVTAATAVLIGALLVGDSVRASLLNLTLDRLGRIDEVLITDRFFREQLAAELADQRGFSKFFDRSVPAIVFTSATVERASGWSSTTGGLTAATKKRSPSKASSTGLTLAGEPIHQCTSTTTHPTRRRL